MKIVIIMKSKFSYDRLKAELSKHTIHPHITTLDDVRDCVQFWQPNLAIIDNASPLKEQAEKLFFRFNINVVHFTSDFGETIQEVETYSYLLDETDNSTTEEDLKEDEPDFSHYEKQLKQTIEPKEKVIVKIEEKIIEKEVERISYTNIPPKLLVFCSLWSGAGSTFVSSNLARAIADRNISVSYIEYPSQTPFMFDFLNISSIETKEEPYRDIARLINNNKVVPRGLAFHMKGIDWIVNDSRTPTIKDWSFEKSLKLIYSLTSPINIIDLSTSWKDDDESIKLLHQADNIYLCIEPDIVRFDRLAPLSRVSEEHQRPEYKFLEKLKQIKREEQINVNFIVTKMNNGIDVGEWKETLEEVLGVKRPHAIFDYIPYEQYVKALWNSQFIYDQKEHQNRLEDSFEPIINEVLPKAFRYRNDKQKNNLINGFIKKFKKGKGTNE